jgi:UDP-N-acetylglucosamine 2-epimerase (non-hydrolysing)
VTFPLHPRTRRRLDQFGLWGTLRAPGLTVTDPVPYSEMLGLVSGSRLVVTDSGGLQEEAAWYGAPTVVLRPTTPRWEGVHAGIAAVVGLDPTRALTAAARFLEPTEQARVAAVPCPYGDGRTGERITALLAEPSVLDLLRIREPELPRSVPAGP